MGSPIRWRHGLFRTGGARISALTLVPCDDQAADQAGSAFWGKFRSARSWKRHGDKLQVNFADDSEARFTFLIQM